MDASLRRLGQDRIDLYYLHRLDPRVPVEESVGALAEAVAAGKIGAIGLSEVSGATLDRAATERPVAAVQNEYSLATRNPEWGLLEACRRHGAALVAFSPVCRGLLTDAPPVVADLPDGDMRHAIPRFQGADVVAIPGTTDPAHWREDRGAEEVSLTLEDLARLDALVNHATVQGRRYSDAQQASVDTEDAPQQG